MLVGRDWSSEHDRVRGSRLAEDEHRHAYCARCCFCSFISRDRIEFRDLYLFISIFKGFLSASSCPHQQYQLPFVCSSVFGVFVSSFLHSVRNGWEVNPVFLFPSFPSHQSIRLPELQSRLKPKKSPDKKKFIRLETKIMRTPSRRQLTEHPLWENLFNHIMRQSRHLRQTGPRLSSVTWCSEARYGPRHRLRLDTQHRRNITLGNKKLTQLVGSSVWPPWHVFWFIHSRTCEETENTTLKLCQDGSNLILFTVCGWRRTKTAKQTLTSILFYC